MVSLQPFGDLPQINLDAEGEFNDFGTWPAYDRNVPWMAEVFGSEAMVEATYTPARDLSTMQRFLAGPELPISASLFQLDNSSRSTRLPRPFQFSAQQQYEPQAPWPFPEGRGCARYGSPDTHRSSWSVSSGSSSSISSVSSTGHCQYPRADVHGGHPSPPQSSGSPEYGSAQDTTTAYYPPFSAFHMDAAAVVAGGGGSCALREIQQYPSPAEEPENPLEGEDAAEVKLEYGAYGEQEPLHYHAAAKMSADDHRRCQRVQDDDDDLLDPIRAESVQPLEVKLEDPADSDYEPGLSGSKRRRRVSQSSMSSRSSSKRTKAAAAVGAARNKQGSMTGTRSNGAGKRAKATASSSSSSSSSTNNSNAAAATADAPRPFPCPLAGYSCAATFASKNEWKRHVSTQHVRLGFWRCALCPSSVDGGATVSFNDFNRKDLFAQHLRRMHFAPEQQQHHKHDRKPSTASTTSTTSSSTSSDNTSTTSTSQTTPTTTITETTMPAFQKTCYRRLRDPPPASTCLFCTRSFAGPGSWDERMEHVGRHFEGARKRLLQLQQQQQHQGHASVGADNGGAAVGGAVGDGGEGDGNGSANAALLPPVHRWREDSALQAWLCREGLVRQDARGKWVLGDGRPRRGEGEGEGECDDGGGGGDGEGVVGCDV